MTYAETVRKAVDDPKWQEFRKSLKGLTTERKIEKLSNYYFDNLDPAKHAGIEPCGPSRSEDWCDVCVRIDNYIKALCRGGQLYAGTDLWYAFEKQFIYLEYKK